MSAPQSAPFAPRLTTSTPSSPRSAAAARRRALRSAYSAPDTPPGTWICSDVASKGTLLDLVRRGRGGSPRAVHLFGLLVPPLAVADLGPQLPATALRRPLDGRRQRGDPLRHDQGLAGV